ncbi:MAG: hypothetical protein KAV87_24745 [Desulfobacteraceae bacterium]|nr:hypothetical protein [Desulfobacteraceae bacterium]
MWCLGVPFQSKSQKAISYQYQFSYQPISDPDATDLGHEAESWGGIQSYIKLAGTSKLFPRVETSKLGAVSRQ